MRNRARVFVALGLAFIVLPFADVASGQGLRGLLGGRGGDRGGNRGGGGGGGGGNIGRMLQGGGNRGGGAPSFRGFSGGSRPSISRPSVSQPSFTPQSASRPSFSQSMPNVRSFQPSARPSAPSTRSLPQNLGSLRQGLRPNTGSSIRSQPLEQLRSNLGSRLGNAVPNRPDMSRQVPGVGSSGNVIRGQSPSNRLDLGNRIVDQTRSRLGSTGQNVRDRLPNLGDRQLGDRQFGDRVIDRDNVVGRDRIDDALGGRDRDGRDRDWDRDGRGRDRDWNDDWRHGRHDRDWDDDWRGRHRHHRWWAHAWYNPWGWYRPWYGHGHGYGYGGYYGYPSYGYGGGWWSPAVYTSGYYSYYNPYCDPGVYIAGTTIDYSYPIVPATSAYSAETEPLSSDPSQVHFDAARDAFLNGDYRTALAEVDLALNERPRDAVLHEFRALVLFALQDYEDAAAAVHAVLAAGPGWDWDTLRTLYPSAAAYTEDLRALEQFRRENPDAAHARFLLAYHYLCCGYRDAAAKELEHVVRLEPQDQLAERLLAAATGENAVPPAQPAVAASQPNVEAARPNAQPAPPAFEPAQPEEVTPAPARRMDAADFIGTWTASRDDGSTFRLQLGADSTFTWKFAQGARTEDLQGKYSVENELLVLEPTAGGAMIGRLTPTEDGFVFRLVGSPEEDRGLSFRGAD